MKNINIKEPCGEDFSKMTKTEKGHFCGKCEIDVYDFTNKSNNEIKSVLRDNIGQQLCGRFNQDSIDSLNTEFYIWQNQNTRSFQSRFVYALIMVFGLTLFSCNEKEARLIGNITTQNASINHTEPSIQKNLVELIEPKISTSVEYLVSERLEYIEDLSSECVPLKENTFIAEYIANPQEHWAIAGGLSWSPDYDSYLIETVIEDSSLNIEDPVIEDILTEAFIDVNVFPNPTKGFASLILNVNKFGQFDIDTYSMTGQKVYTIHTGDLDEGRQEFQLDLSDFQNGTYFILIKSEEKQETVKIQKM